MEKPQIQKGTPARATALTARAPRATPSQVTEQAGPEADPRDQKLWNSERFSDLVIKFSGREIKAHRLVLCQASAYFDKLCGPISHFAEANKSEIELQGDDADAVEAMLRYLYGFRFTPPTPSLKTDDKVRYYCNVVVVADNYNLPSLAQEALKSLKTFVTSVEEAALLLESLVILTDEYPDYESLEQCATTLAKPRVKELSSIPTFPAWLAKRHLIVQDLVEDATEFRSKFKTLKPMDAWQCSFCKNVLLVATQPKCCRNMCGSVGIAYVHHFVYGSERPMPGPQRQ